MGAEPETGDSAFEAAPCGLLRTRTDGSILKVNQLFCEWVGYEREDLVGQKRLQDLFTIGARMFHQTHWAPLMQMQGSVSEVKLEVRHRTGETIPMVLNARVATTDTGSVHEIAAFVARDRDQYERELLCARRRLEGALAEVTRLKGLADDRASLAEQMIGIVGHDLRNPLSAISLGVQILGEAELSGTQASVVNRIHRSIDRARQLIADLLDFTEARMGGGLRMEPTSIQLHPAVGQIVDELTPTAGDRLLRHRQSGDGTCEVDVHRLSQLIGNLVANALTYGAPSTPVTIKSVVETDSFRVEVHNEGPPIPSEAQESLFLPMTRAAGASNPSRSIGLGLFIVRMIAEGHGGTVSVRSSEAEGTTFLATFPRS